MEQLGVCKFAAVGGGTRRIAITRSGCTCCLMTGKKIGLAVICCPCNTNPQDAAPTAGAMRFFARPRHYQPLLGRHPLGDNGDGQ